MILPLPNPGFGLDKAILASIRARASRFTGDVDEQLFFVRLAIAFRLVMPLEFLYLSYYAALRSNSRVRCAQIADGDGEFLQTSEL